MTSISSLVGDASSLANVLEDEMAAITARAIGEYDFSFNIGPQNKKFEIRQHKEAIGK
ncbi:hypothetical protein TUM4445_13860 [Shewanella sp. MBTL60-112-B2]|nr:hypothetical protein TUM4444_07870 [Shewanella sp. MBTL60-112-B1]GIU30470.1 hypothetical protein TUM4445_13860 [Shewanella sp. MBTL60-112-B2]